MLVRLGEVDEAFELVQGRWVVVDADVDDDSFPRVLASGAIDDKQRGRHLATGVAAGALGGDAELPGSRVTRND
jgi:hypothetical protein